MWTSKLVERQTGLMMMRIINTTMTTLQLKSFSSLLRRKKNLSHGHFEKFLQRRSKVELCLDTASGIWHPAERSRGWEEQRGNGQQQQQQAQHRHWARTTYNSWDLLPHHGSLRDGKESCVLGGRWGRAEPGVGAAAGFWSLLEKDLWLYLFGFWGGFEADMIISDLSLYFYRQEVIQVALQTWTDKQLAVRRCKPLAESQLERSEGPKSWWEFRGHSELCNCWKGNQFQNFSVGNLTNVLFFFWFVCIFDSDS